MKRQYQNSLLHPFATATKLTSMNKGENDRSLASRRSNPILPYSKRADGTFYSGRASPEKVPAKDLAKLRSRMKNFLKDVGDFDFKQINTLISDQFSM